MLNRFFFKKTILLISVLSGLTSASASMNIWLVNKSFWPTTFYLTNDKGAVANLNVSPNKSVYATLLNFDSSSPISLSTSAYLSTENIVDKNATIAQQLEQVRRFVIDSKLFKKTTASKGSPSYKSEPIQIGTLSGDNNSFVILFKVDKTAERGYRIFKDEKKIEDRYLKRFTKIY